MHPVRQCTHECMHRCISVRTHLLGQQPVLPAVQQRKDLEATQCALRHRLDLGRSEDVELHNPGERTGCERGLLRPVGDQHRVKHAHEALGGSHGGIRPAGW